MKKKMLLLVFLHLLLLKGFGQSVWTHGPLQVTPDGHYLQYSDGTPFFWLGDTGWELFHRLNKKEVENYLENRRRKGFNVIQAVAPAIVGGLEEPNRFGELPFKNLDPLQPNEKYFAWVDTVIDMAKQKGLFIALLPCWGDHVATKPGEKGGPVIINIDNAYKYATWIGKRYAAYPNIIWILGGDMPAIRDSNDWRPVWRAMAKGIQDVTQNKALITYHPQGGPRSTSQTIHNEDWLKMNMFQSSHGSGHDVPVWDWVKRDRALSPVKPTLDAEPNYEDHPVNPWPTWDPANGYFNDYDVRKQTYRSVFAGACGVTYGHHSIWQFWSERYENINHAMMYWTKAIDRQGAFQVGYLRRLIESRDILNRIPYDAVIVEGQGEKGGHMVAFRDADNNYAMVYLPIGKTVAVNGSFIKADKVMAWWFDTKTGKATKIGLQNKSDKMLFTPPVLGEGNDWVLVLDNPAKHFSAPGSVK